MLSSASASAAVEVASAAGARRVRWAWRLAGRRFWRNGNARAGAFLIAGFVLVAVLAPRLVPEGFDDENLPGRLQPPTAAIEEHEYVTAARALGARTWRILTRTVLPNAASPLVVQATLGVAGAILEAAALGYLGLGAQPPAAEWGVMLSDGYKYLLVAFWAALAPGAAIALVVLSFNLAGDGLRDALDPRLLESF
jgi:peptide/nickel transport system permease protein